MAMGRRTDQQEEFWVATERIAKSPGHPFYDALGRLLREHDFDRFCEARCRKFYAEVMGRPGLAPGVYFRMLMIGYFEGLDSERGIDWRCADSLSLKQFLGYAPTESTPDHSTISRTRRLIDLETHREIFDWVLKVVAEHGLLKGNKVGIDASTMEANAALRSIIRKDTRETYQEFLTKLAKDSGIETPTKEQLIALDRKRKDKTLSNTEWVNPHDTDAKVTRMKDGRTHFAYKNEHAVDLESGAILAAEIHPADQGDTSTGGETLSRACGTLSKLTKDKDVGHKVMTAAAMDGPADSVAEAALRRARLLTQLGDHAAASKTLSSMAARCDGNRQWEPTLLAELVPALARQGRQREAHKALTELKMKYPAYEPLPRLAASIHTPSGGVP